MSADILTISHTDLCRWLIGEIRVRIRFPDGVSSEVTGEECRQEMARQRADVARIRQRTSSPAQYSRVPSHDPDGGYRDAPHSERFQGWPDRAAPLPASTLGTGGLALDGA